MIKCHKGRCWDTEDFVSVLRAKGKMDILDEIVFDEIEQAL